MWRVYIPVLQSWLQLHCYLENSTFACEIIQHWVDEIENNILFELRKENQPYCESYFCKRHRITVNLSFVLYTFYRYFMTPLYNLTLLYKLEIHKNISLGTWPTYPTFKHYNHTLRNIIISILYKKMYLSNIVI